MATTFASPYSGYQTQPYTLPQADQAYGAKIQVYRAKITLASQAAADIIKLFKLPKGCLPLYGILSSDTSLGSTTIQIGITGTTAKYKADAVFTATNTPTLFGKTNAQATALTADEEVILTVSTATAPSSGTVTIDMFVAAI